MAASPGQQEELGPSSPIPDKLYFKIGEVSRLVGVQAHVLRYWQSEIAAIRPGKSVSNQRRYRYRDVEVFREIKRLLYDERYTLAGARRRIMSRDPVASTDASNNAVDPTLETVIAAPVAAFTTELAVGLPAHVTTPSSGSIVSPPVVPAWPAAASSFVAPPVVSQADAVDDELVQRLRRGLKELIRFAGEEP